MSSRTRIVDIREGAGRLAGHVDSPTFAIPHGCLCTWSVVRPGVGWNCVSRLRYANALCRHIRDHQRVAVASAARITQDPWGTA